MQWKLASEELPEPFEDVLVMFDDGDYKVLRLVNVLHDDNTDSLEWGRDTDDIFPRERIVAWTYIDECPYKQKPNTITIVL